MSLQAVEVKFGLLASLKLNMQLGLAVKVTKKITETTNCQCKPHSQVVPNGALRFLNRCNHGQQHH